MKERFNKRLETYIGDYWELGNLDKNLNEYLLSKVSNTDRIAIWGTGGHTEVLLKKLKLDNLNIVCFIDNSKNKKRIIINGKDVIQSDNIKELEIDAIIISSFTYHSEIKKQIQDLNEGYKIIDFYDSFDIGCSIYGDLIDILLIEYANWILTIYNDMRLFSCLVNKCLENSALEVINYNNLESKLSNEVFEEKALEFIYQKEHLKNRVFVDFFIQYPQGWTSVESVWNAFKRDDRVVVRIIQIPFIHDLRDNSKDELKDFLIEQKIPFIPWYIYDVDVENPDVVIYQSPYDLSRPKEFSSDRISKTTRIVYIPYGLEIGGGESNITRQFNLTLHNKAWLICSRSERHKNMYEKYCDAGSNHVTVTGHPKIDSMYNLKEIKIAGKIKEITKGKKVFLWNPHFSTNPIESWSTFNVWQDKILDIFEKRKNAILIIRPHPLMLDRIDREDGMDIPGIKTFNERVNNMKNVLFDRSFDYRHSFIISDALISDASSFLLEYLPTQKPIMYLPKLDGPGLNDDGDIVEYYYNAYKAQEIEEFVEIVINDLDTMKNIRISKINEYLGLVDGKVGERIKESILQKYLLDTKYLKDS